MKDTIETIIHSECTGCSACHDTCPVSAIQMLPDCNGFLYPQIDPAVCIRCGKCLKSCPVNAPDHSNDPAPSAYAVWADDDTRMSSSSGGFFSLASRWVFQHGGCVFGARYTEDYYGVYHTSAENEEELKPLRGSKYVQSDTRSIYKQVKSVLEQGRMALFTGTPCQVAGLKKYLCKDYDNLYTIDLACHGVPSPKLYSQFVHELEDTHSSKVNYLNFRDKYSFGWNPSTSVRFETASDYLRKRNDSPYMHAFLAGITNRDCCGACKFAEFPRQGDLTMADFWDVHRWSEECDDCKGTSVVLVNSDKGTHLLEHLQPQMKLFREAPIEHAIRYNWNLAHSSVNPPKRDYLYELLRTHDFTVEKAVNWAINGHYDVGIIGWWYGKNYGSAMTNFALNRVLTDMGKSVLMLDWPGNGVTNAKPPAVLGKYYSISRPLTIANQYKLNENVDCFLVGSDQVWHWWSNRDLGSKYYFLDFVNDDHKKIAYASSFGHDSAFYPSDLRQQIGLLMSRMDKISVREESGVKRCGDTFGREDAVLTADPVFLCDPKYFREVADCSPADTSKPYLFAYILNPSAQKLKAVQNKANQLGVDYLIVLDNQGDIDADYQKMECDPNIRKNVPIEDWLKYIRDAAYVVTDSYHGYCFSLIFQKEFFVFPNKQRGLARFQTLANLTHTGAHFSTGELEIDVCKDLPPVDYGAVNAQFEPFLQFSRTWLQNALEMDKKGVHNTDELFANQILKLQKTDQEQSALMHSQHDQLQAQLSQLATQLQTVSSHLNEVESQYQQRVSALEYTVRQLDNTFSRKFKRKFLGGVQCLKDNGLKYTWVHFWEKVWNKLGK